jgi:cell division protein FtsA
MGGALITKDLAIGLKAPLQDAEEIKQRLGTVFPYEVPDEEIIEIREMGSGRQRVISRRLLCQIIEARSEEIINAVADIMRKAKVRTELISGLVMTGGGSLLQGFPDKAREKLGIEVRLGYPVNFRTRSDDVLNPSYATVLGLLRYAKDIQPDQPETPAISVLNKLKNWLMEKI